MDSRVLKVFVAVALGAFVGALVALQLNPLVWWLGLAVGGLIGYLVYEPMVVIRTIPIAARNAYEASGEGLQKIVNIATTILSAFLLGCRRMKSRRKELFWYLAGGWTAGFWVVVAMNFPFLCIPAKYRDLGTCSKFNLTISPLVFIGITAIVVIALLITSESDLPEDKRRFRWIATRRNPVIVLWYALCLIPGTAKFLVRFTATLFRLIHSDIRLLCGVDAAIGAAVGYFTQNAIVGAAIGGLFGALNFEILSKRVLRLVPLRSRL